ncbi:MAG: glycerophosphodiester phosphodiesterase [Gammaproteobacteria bacterium]
MNATPRNHSQIFAHRGARLEAAENTRAAFDKALCYPIDGIETDVQLSRDGVPVLWHDSYLTKLGYPGKRIDDFDFEALKQMDFAGHFSENAVSEGVLSLEEFVETYRGRCSLQIEIKNRAWEQPQRHHSKMKQCIQIAGLSQQLEIFISSFHLSSLVYAHAYLPDFPLYFALDENASFTDVQKSMHDHPFFVGLCLPITILDYAMAQHLRDNGKKIVVYTCNSDNEIGKALELRADIIITDDPERALSLRDRDI